jgi:hypothetical protein
MFKCKSCAAHMDHIQSLKAQIADLRRLALPQNQQLPEVLVDLDSPALEGTDLAEEPTAPLNQEEQRLIDQEAAALLSGTY